MQMIIGRQIRDKDVKAFERMVKKDSTYLHINTRERFPKPSERRKEKERIAAKRRKKRLRKQWKR